MSTPQTTKGAMEEAKDKVEIGALKAKDAYKDAMPEALGGRGPTTQDKVADTVQHGVNEVEKAGLKIKDKAKDVTGIH